MPEEDVIRRAEQDKEEGKSPSTQAGEFVREEIEHVREGKHGARSPQQAIAIGLSKARRAGVKLPPPKRGRTSARTRRQARRDLRKGRSRNLKSRRGRGASPRRSRAVRGALRREGRGSASRRALSRQAHSAARRRGSSSRHAAAMKAVRTKGHRRMSQSARKAARTRRQHRKAA